VSTEIMPTTLAGRAMDRWVCDNLIDWAAGLNAKDETKARLRRELDDFAASLAGPTPSPAERLLAETAALDWCFVRTSQARMAGGYAAENGLTFAQSEHHQRRVDRAHRRLLRTLTTLATVRRLALPALQVNFGAQQVNVAGVPALASQGGGGAKILDVQGPDRTGPGTHELTGGNGLSSAS